MKHWNYNKEFEEKYKYMGDDLGAIYTPEKTTFRVWAPTAETVTLKLYEDGERRKPLDSVKMEKSERGTWVAELSGDRNGLYYNYEVTVDSTTREAVDPYAKAVGVNGECGMVIDLAATDPEGFAGEERPQMIPLTDAVIYESHVRDLTVDEGAGNPYPGKFLGVGATGTKNRDGASTGLDYMKELGVTHLQLLPVYDYATVNEADTGHAVYNWGYDPKNYNVPEGSYSTDPFHGEVRVREFKQMVQAIHKEGLLVIMDVVYNHTYDAEDFCFQKIVPDYFFRKTEDGRFSDGSACGNETASDHVMVRKYIIDSVCYWAKEYHIDGFRFDLMGILDKETMRELRKAVDQINPGIALYGEGWTGGPCAIDAKERCMKADTWQLDGIGAFNDDIRDSIKGSVFYAAEPGFVNGGSGFEEAIRFSVTGAVGHPAVHFNNEAGVWAEKPEQSINYVSCHDNYTLWDKLKESCPDAPVEVRKAMNNLAAAIVYTAQGVPFMQAGEELLRSKPTDTTADGIAENSYNLPDETNRIRWNTRSEHADVFAYYQGLIAFRKAHAGLRMRTAEEIAERIIFKDTERKNVVAYEITGSKERLFIVYNANTQMVQVELPGDGTWELFIDKNHAGNVSLGSVSGNVTVEGISAAVFVQKI